MPGRAGGGAGQGRGRAGSTDSQEQGRGGKQGGRGGAHGFPPSPPPPSRPPPARTATAAAATATAAAVATGISGEDSPATRAQRQLLLAMQAGSNNDASSDCHHWHEGGKDSLSARTCQ